MVEVRGDTIVLKADSPLTNVTMQQCVDRCLQGCWCAAALHITAYLVFGHRRYSYWDLTPRNNKSKAFAGMDVSGLTMLDLSGQPGTRILPAVEKSGAGLQGVRFFELGNNGNLGLYFLDQGLNGFSATYKAHRFYQLPLACGIHGVCSSSETCDDFSLYGVRGDTIMLKADLPLTNVTMQQCVDRCLQGCSCAAALHVRDDASITDDTAGGASGVMTAGSREVIGGSAWSNYWVKVVKRITNWGRGS
ncbi:hypothetical protein BRADI_4g10748v3 [Brachypodium distachyon]|uniref:Apple domain-containing protein n=1 Tax=Brachypodium distachyon TaxID=15368 RepID=A0A0Q3L465_BRADI|nr:hypothetical protein BRADI_4g10748v3 [Brachypodium distachyon]